MNNAEMINECLENSEILTEWESEFITSVKVAIDEGRSLSEKQKKILVRIHGKSLNSEEVAGYQEMLGKCLEKSDLLKEWDSEFLGSISSVLDKGYTLSEKQASSLKRIFGNVNKPVK